MQRQRDSGPLCANLPRNIIDENDHNTTNDHYASGYCFFGNAARRPESELFKDLILPNHDQRRRGTTLQAASRRPRMTEKGLGKREHMTVEPGVPPSETWSTQLMMPVQTKRERS